MAEPVEDLALNDTQCHLAYVLTAPLLFSVLTSFRKLNFQETKTIFKSI